MIIFLLIFLASYIVAFREVLMGNRAGVLTFMIFGLSMYTTAMSVAFISGFKAAIPAMQYFKEILILTALLLNIIALRKRPRFHLIDYLIMGYLGYLTLYAILPIGEQSFFNRMLALKSSAFFVIVYFTGRLIDPKTVYIGKYLNYLVLLTIAAGAITLIEWFIGTPMQTITGYADYNFYFFNQDPAGMFGLNTTFESDSGYARFASFFASPLEHAGATLIALAVIAGLYTRDDNKFSFTSVGILGLIASFISILLALSRAPLISYFLIIYVYALITKRKYITKFIHAGAVVVGLYVFYLFIQFEQSNSGIMEVVLNTIDFSDPSSVGHVQQWLEGILAIQQHPLGMGLGSSGRVAASVSENVGGENQFIIIAVQAGLIAMGIYLSIFILSIKTSLKWLPLLKGRERKLCIAVLLIKVGIFIPLLTSEAESSTYISYLNWFLTGLLISMIMQHQGAADVETTAIETAYA
jgi:hypothetical protein